jgi:large subunit ribosomal protein L28
MAGPQLLHLRLKPFQWFAASRGHSLRAQCITSSISRRSITATANVQQKPSITPGAEPKTKRRVKRTHTSGVLPRLSVPLPPYPPGPSRVYKQGDRGLYGGTKVMFGNHVAEAPHHSQKAGKKVRRRWNPNVQYHQLYSESLGRSFRFRLTTGVMRTIDRVGGLDNYLLEGGLNRIKQLGVAGWHWRWHLMQTKSYNDRFQKEAEKLGIGSEIVEKVLEERTNMIKDLTSEPEFKKEKPPKLPWRGSTKGKIKNKDDLWPPLDFVGPESLAQSK